MSLYLFLRAAHELGVLALFGVPLAAFYFVTTARRSGDAALAARTARRVVMSDLVMTATAVVAQPVTGIALANITGQSVFEGWILVSLVFYVAIGVLWLPVMITQAKMREVADAAAETGAALPPRYHSLHRRWVTLGSVVAVALAALTVLMIVKPSIPALQARPASVGRDTTGPAGSVARTRGVPAYLRRGKGASGPAGREGPGGQTPPAVAK